MENNNPSKLNIANIANSTYALGPGHRAAIWVQGCPFHCLGCLAPQWIPNIPARLLSPEQIVEELLAIPTITGLTFSGGEPMHQAIGLAQVARLARQNRDLDIICFTGFRYETLLQKSPSSGIPDLLREVDVLIDGNYIQERNTGQGLRGSDNQRIIYLTEKLRMHNLEDSPRLMEIHIRTGEWVFIGIPPLPVGEVLNAESHKGILSTGGDNERI
jgi:anaerobic ribonucleoside-triphosphate reductase activating protein